MIPLAHTLNNQPLEGTQSTRMPLDGMFNLVPTDLRHMENGHLRLADENVINKGKGLLALFTSHLHFETRGGENN